MLSEKHWRWIARAADAYTLIGIVILVVGASATWLAASFDTQLNLTPWAWLATFFLGTGFLLVCAAIGIRALPKEPKPPPAIELPTRTFEPLPKLSDTIPKLYIGEMGVDLNPLRKGDVIEIWFRGFNATGRTLSVHRIEGAISLIENAGLGRTELGKLPIAVALRDRDPVGGFADNAEMLIVIEQRLDSDAAAALRHLGEASTFVFDLDDLTVLMTDTADGAWPPAKLPIWPALNLGIRKELRTTRGYVMKAEAGKFQVG